MLSEIGRTIYHTQYLDHSLYLVEATKVRLDGRQHGKSYLLGGEFAFIHRQVLADTSDDQGLIIPHRPVTGKIQVFAIYHTRLVNSGRAGAGGKVNPNFSKFSSALIMLIISFIYMLVKKYIDLFPDSFRYRLIRGDRDSL